MPTEDEQREMHPAFEELLLDIAENEKRAVRAKALETKHELAENVWPMFKALAEACNTRMEEIEEAMEELLSEEGNVLYADLAQPLFGLIDIAKRMTAHILDGQMTDLKWQALRNDAQLMAQTVAILEPIAAQAVVQDVDDEDGGEDEDEDGEDDDDDDGPDDDGGEPAAAADGEVTHE